MNDTGSVRHVDFCTFLGLTGNEDLLETVSKADSIGPLPKAQATRLANLVRLHMATGCLSDVVATWTETHDFSQVDAMLDAHLEYLAGESARELHIDIARCRALWEHLPRQMGREHSGLPHGMHREQSEGIILDPLLLWLVAKGVMLRIRRLDRPADPVESYVYQSQYKYYLTDTGILRRLARLPATTVDEQRPDLSRFRGMLTESYVLATMEPLCGNQVWYWKSGSRAEVDFIIRMTGALLPVEVKTARNVKSRSLALYRRVHCPRLALRYSLLNLKLDGDLLNIPLYLAHRTPTLVQRALMGTP